MFVSAFFLNLDYLSKNPYVKIIFLKLNSINFMFNCVICLRSLAATWGCLWKHTHNGCRNVLSIQCIVHTYTQIWKHESTRSSCCSTCVCHCIRCLESIKAVLHFKRNASAQIAVHWLLRFMKCIQRQRKVNWIAFKEHFNTRIFWEILNSKIGDEQIKEIVDYIVSIWN